MNEAQLIRPDLMVSKKHFIPGPCFSCESKELLAVVDIECTNYVVDENKGTVKTEHRLNAVVCYPCFTEVYKFMMKEKRCE